MSEETNGSAEVAQSADTPKAKAEFQVFGSVDLNDKGNIKSTYPAWYFDHLMDDLRNDISRIETNLKFDRIPRDQVFDTQSNLSKKKEKLKSLENSMPNLKGKQKDQFAKIREELGEKISGSMFTRDEMRKGLADAREEMKRATEPCIEVRGDSVNFARACNVKIIKGKVSRDGAAKMWKIASKALEEPTNVERLRRD